MSESESYDRAAAVFTTGLLVALFPATGAIDIDGTGGCSDGCNRLSGNVDIAAALLLPANGYSFSKRFLCD